MDPLKTEVQEILSRISNRKDLTTIPTFGPKCRKCDDLRYREREDGRWGACECLLEERRMEKYASLLKQANMELYQDMTLANYRPKNESQKAALNSVRAVHRGYYLLGPWGVGKTHLMAGTVLRALAERIPAALFSLPLLLDEIRKGLFNGDCGHVEELARRIPYLGLDDIGKEKVTERVEERLFILLDERYKLFRGGKGHTSFTSQFKLSTLGAKFDGAIIDRIRGMVCEIFIDGESQR